MLFLSVIIKYNFSWTDKIISSAKIMFDKIWIHHQDDEVQGRAQVMMDIVCVRRGGAVSCGGVCGPCRRLAAAYELVRTLFN